MFSDPATRHLGTQELNRLTPHGIYKTELILFMTLADTTGYGCGNLHGGRKRRKGGDI